jgi:GSH-dependent disulfide-bond oxidoreductase
MIELYYWPTPNGWKISIALEEMELAYTVRYVNIARGEQFAPEFLKISPNNRMPAIVDHDPPGGGAPIAVFESGAILLYLAEKCGRFLPTDLRGRYDVTQWVMWQMGGLGPMGGQVGHFRLYAPEPIPYAIDRYTDEVNRLYGVMDRRLAGREYLAGECSIADFASWPWVVPHERHGQRIADFPNLHAWYERMKERPGVRRGFDVGVEIRRASAGGPDAEARKVLFGQRARAS